MKSDLLPILLATAEGTLSTVEPPEWDPRVCVGVVAAAEGYPGTVRKGDRINGLAAAEKVEDVVVFHAGTARDADGAVVTAGGRVLCVTSLGTDLEQARSRAYQAYDAIGFDGKFCRRDIGTRQSSRAPDHHMRAALAEGAVLGKGALGGDTPAPARRPERRGAPKKTDGLRPRPRDAR
jgi:phosphoribosylamine--glycine ligase